MFKNLQKKVALTGAGAMLGLALVAIPAASASADVGRVGPFHNQQACVQGERDVRSSGFRVIDRCYHGSNGWYFSYGY